MTRVSDTAAFAEACAEAGGLPFLALALMRGPRGRRAAAETTARLAGEPWGVGILSASCRPSCVDEQTRGAPAVRAAVSRSSPAAGPTRPARSRATASRPTCTCPSPGCSNVPRQAARAASSSRGASAAATSARAPASCSGSTRCRRAARRLATRRRPRRSHVVFAGGIHDARSAAMVAAHGGAAGGARRRSRRADGHRLPVHEEAVEPAAIVADVPGGGAGLRAGRCSRDRPRPRDRCADSPFCDMSSTETPAAASPKAHPADEIRDAAREAEPRPAAHGVEGQIVRQEWATAAPSTSTVDAEEQRRDGMYMIGQVAALRARVTTHRRAASPTIGAGAPACLDSAGRGRSRPRRRRPPPLPADIAIVGMGCLLPGRRRRPDASGTTSLDKVDAITRGPDAIASDWRPLSTTPTARRATRSTRGGAASSTMSRSIRRYGIPPARCRRSSRFSC